MANPIGGLRAQDMREESLSFKIDELAPGEK